MLPSISSILFIDIDCHIIIIACNTASAMAVNYLRDKYKDIQFIAIEPAVKLAYDLSTDATLIMATKGTMDSEKFHQLYDKYHHENFYLLSCTGLANLIEENDIDKVRNYLKNQLSVYRGKVCNVVLGCTHYPLIKDYIKEVLGDVLFFDGAVGVAKRLSQIIHDYQFVGDGKGVFFEDSFVNLPQLYGPCPFPGRAAAAHSPPSNRSISPASSAYSSLSG